MKAFSTAPSNSEFQPASIGGEVMSVPEACTYLGIHRNTLYKLISEGEIPAFRLSTGSRWKFRRGDLEDWLADRKARSVR
jgi:excisionase family DNA binding protein